MRERERERKRKEKEEENECVVPLVAKSFACARASHHLAPNICLIQSQSSLFVVVRGACRSSFMALCCGRMEVVFALS